MKVLRNKDFYKLFFLREFTTLSGNKLSNLIIMVVMLFISFTVIGFAEGSLRYLELKMKDPFINWVNVIPWVHQGVPINRVINELNSEEVKRGFSLLNAIGYNRYQLNFYDYEDVQEYYRTGLLFEDRISGFSARTLDLEDPVMPEIFTGKNLIRGHAYDDFMNVGLIVTSDLLFKLNYPGNTSHIWMDLLAYRAEDLTEIRIPIPVKVNAVVKSLPGMAGFASTSYFYQQRNLEFGRNPFNPIYDGRLVLSFNGEREQAQELAATVDQIINECLPDGSFAPDRVLSEMRVGPGNEEWYLIFVTFRPRNVPMAFLDKLFHALYNHHNFASYRKNTIRTFDYETKLRSFRVADEYDRISLNFSNLDKLREFSIMLQKKYSLEVDMAQIESRENYNFISRLTGIISIVLIGFSILSVLLFMAYLLKRHLEGIKKNLGTFKAFGLSNDFLKNIYVQIVLFMLGLTIMAALILSAAFGYTGGMRLILFLFASQFEPGNYFSLLSYYLVIALTILVVFSVMVLRTISNKILNHTPGDLIYERQ